MFNLHTYLPTQHERNWAMLAHLSIWLTIGTGFAMGGLSSVLALLLPLALYMYFRNRSPYIAFHALQSTVFQALSAIGFVVFTSLVGSALAVAWVITALLSVLIVGVLLIPVSFVLTLVGIGCIVAWPVSQVLYATRGAYLAYTGTPFEYVWVGGVVARSMGPVTASSAAPVA